jgi:hypothetical protein
MTFYFKMCWGKGVGGRKYPGNQRRCIDETASKISRHICDGVEKMMKGFVSIQPRSFYSDGLQKPVDCWAGFMEEQWEKSENVHGVTAQSKRQRSQSVCSCYSLRISTARKAGRGFQTYG